MQIADAAGNPFFKHLAISQVGRYDMCHASLACNPTILCYFDMKYHSLRRPPNMALAIKSAKLLSGAIPFHGSKAP